MDITPINLDYLKASLDDIVKGEVARLELMIQELKEDGKLCCETGRELVAEFGFKGDINQVIEQVEDYITDIETNGISDSDRITLQERRIAAANSDLTENIYMEKFKEAMEKGDTKIMIELAQRKSNLHEMLHEKKECLCYSNL